MTTDKKKNIVLRNRETVPGGRQQALDCPCHLAIFKRRTSGFLLRHCMMFRTCKYLRKRAIVSSGGLINES